MSRSARNRRKPKSTAGGPLRLYGLHTVRAALANPDRRKLRLLASENALGRLDVSPLCPVEIVRTEAIDRFVGREAVHQGVVLECEALERLDGSELFQLAEARLVLVLDQVTDPHNVGAILRTAVAMAADCVLVTHREAAPETGVLAKSASGALDLVRIGEVRNLSRAVAELRKLGLFAVGLDSEADADLIDALEEAKPERIALVLGSEGRGLRQQTREACDAIARLDLPGPIKSLNVSNAAALSLYLARARIEA